MLRSLLPFLVLTTLCTTSVSAETPIPTAPAVDARAYILVDYRTDKTLAAQEATARMEPASLTKLMTAYIVFEELASGKLKLDESVTVSEKAWRSEGSRTFIELGKPVSVELLILGMIVQSGNDATIALAERVGGYRGDLRADDECQCQAARHGRDAFRQQHGAPRPQPLHHGPRHVAARHRHDPRLSSVL